MISFIQNHLILDNSGSWQLLVNEISTAFKACNPSDREQIYQRGNNDFSPACDATNIYFWYPTSSHDKPNEHRNPWHTVVDEPGDRRGCHDHDVQSWGLYSLNEYESDCWMRLDQS